MRPTLIVALAASAIAAAAVSAAPSAPARAHATRALAAAPPPVTLRDALAVSKPLGPVAARATIHLSFGLHGRNAAQLEHVLAEGRSLTPAQLAAGYGPDASRVRGALALLRRAGLSTGWQVSEQLAFASGPAATVERLFGVSLERYATPQGRRFYAPLGRPVVPLRLRRVVSAVLGLDDFARAATAAVRPGGVTPGDVLSFYDVQPLRASGLTGAGETVVFPELSSPAELPQLRQDLAAFAQRFHLPPFRLSEHHGPGWQPNSLEQSRSAKDLEETALDLEIVHAIAPGAKLAIYELSRNIVGGLPAELAMVTDDPQAIISDSTGFCERIVPDAAAARALAQPWVRAAAQGTTHFVASGDSGAYTCTQAKPPAVDFTSGTCAATSVGGTTIFESRSGGYYRELAWGNPISESGGGGGVSRIFQRPSWQTGPGVREAASTSGCQVPDVAGLADLNTGWQIRVYGKWTQIGGTSAAAPLWSGIAALIDQDLRQKGLKPIGFATPALYWMGRHEAQFSPRPFHDVTAGNNLLYAAGPGWDFATGWGSPDALGLERAWETYRRSVSR